MDLAVTRVRQGMLDYIRILLNVVSILLLEAKGRCLARKNNSE